VLKFLDRYCIAMLKRQFRLKTKDIKFVAFKGKKFSSEFFDIRVISDSTLGNPVMTVSISVKVSKRAVVRNRIKRLFREAFSQLMKEGKLESAKYLVVAKSAKLEEMKTQEVKELILSTLAL
jgi:ribonuclease P protein component